MSSSTLSSINSSRLQSTLTGTTAASDKTNASSTDFASSLAQRLAEFESQSLGSLLSVAAGDAPTSSILGLLTGGQGPSFGAGDIFSLLGGSAASTGLSASGFNLSLKDPQSAFQMMSVINTRDVNYKAQYAELSEMKGAVAELEDSGETLGSVGKAMDDAAIASELQAFVADYNEWIARFDATVQKGGVLEGTQAAEISLYELEQSIENNFNGAAAGFHGLDDLGLTIDETSNLAALDTGVLSAALASNREGVISTLKEFSANFAKSAELLTSADNFIENRLANLDRVIDYIGDNKSSLQTEFGLGDAARPSAQVAEALAAYQKKYVG